MNTINLIEQELKKTYPTRIVSDLKRTNEDLYLKLKEYSKENNTSIKNLLESRDYVYLRKSIIRLYVDDFLELEKAFPDFKINNFYENQNKLYYRILAHAKSVKVSLKRYLNSLGFEYEAREELSNDSTKNELQKLYPNNVVTNLSKTDNKLYYRVYQQAKKENLTMKEYLEKLGFETKNVKTRKSNKEKTSETAKTVKKNPKKTSSKKKTSEKTSEQNNTSNKKEKTSSVKKNTKNAKTPSNTNKRKSTKRTITKKENKSTKNK